MGASCVGSNKPPELTIQEQCQKQDERADVELKFLFKLLDINRDRQLISEEFMQLFPRTAKQLFKTLDVDGDRRLSYDEFKKAFCRQNALDKHHIAKVTKQLLLKFISDQKREVEFQKSKNLLMQNELTRFVDPDNWKQMELSPFQLHKIKHLFSLWRTNEDGIIKRHFFHRFKTIARMNGVQWKEIRRDAYKFWATLCVESPKSGTCSEEMFIDSWKYFINTQIVWDYYEEFKKETFFYKVCNVDNAGYFYETEWNNMMTNLGVDMIDSSQAFIDIDSNEDQVVSRREFRCAIVNFITSNDPQNPSNTLFGPLPEFNAEDYIEAGKLKEKKTGWNWFGRSTETKERGDPTTFPRQDSITSVGTFTSMSSWYSTGDRVRE